MKTKPGRHPYTWVFFHRECGSKMFLTAGRSCFYSTERPPLRLGDVHLLPGPAIQPLGKATTAPQAGGTADPGTDIWATII
jgi:hypothetical protein